MENQQIEAVFEGGMFKPLVPVYLAEHQRVSITIVEEDDDQVEDSDYESFIAEDGDPDITWEEVRRITAKLPGSLADDVDRERDERC